MTIETGYACPTPGSPCVKLCGNKVIDSPEACDDGNTIAGDGCSADCMTIEPGWQCPTPGSPCTPKCGDNYIITPIEGCDYGTTPQGPGCSSTC